MSILKKSFFKTIISVIALVAILAFYLEIPVNQYVVDLGESQVNTMPSPSPIVVRYL
ncbi:hypothetical protein ACJROX_20005 [Pseudalkalibacillus sp. A8]|uniref:hypothetical protein n=1 Tax=Pseudalkalibacillus sp. A8 TaxID=3382641 RepID=UPI0038B6989F